jgi:thiol:disulfide interchange protein DsbC
MKISTLGQLHAVHAILVVAFNTAAAGELETRLAGKLRAVIPDAIVTSVREAPLPGLYEVMLGATVLYMTEDGRFAVRGDLFDLESRKNLTEATRGEARIAALAREGSQAIEFKAEGGKTDHTIYVFTDIDCGYCRKMHQEVTQLNAAGITVRYLAFPRSGLEGESYNKAVAVWCAADQKAALTAAKQGQKLEKKSCNNPVAAQYHLGESVGVRGTPAVFLENGRELGGYVPAAELIRMFKSGEI